MDSLQGMFLVATNQMVDPRFKQTVILICNHDERGALGLVLTNPYDEIRFTDILTTLKLKITDISYPDIYCGGPVALDSLFILHPPELSNVLFRSTEVMAGVFLGNDLDLLAHYSSDEKVKDIRFFLGYSGWGAGQLEQELGFDGWLVLPATAFDVFHCPSDTLWQQVTAKHGIDITIFDDISGNA